MLWTSSCERPSKSSARVLLLGLDGLPEPIRRGDGRREGERGARHRHEGIPNEAARARPRPPPAPLAPDQDDDDERGQEGKARRRHHDHARADPAQRLPALRGDGTDTPEPQGHQPPRSSCSAATRIEFPGLNHGASGKKNRGTKPERIARELRTFFAQDTQLGAGVGRSQTPQSHLPNSDPLGAGT
jgi:hypothetical protein